MHGPPDSYGPWCGAPAAPHLVGPENIHDFGVLVSHIFTITRKDKFCRTLCDIYFKDLIPEHYLSKLSNGLF